MCQTMRVDSMHWQTRTCLLMWLPLCMLVAWRSRAMSRSSEPYGGRRFSEFLRGSPLPLALPPLPLPWSVAIMTIAWAERWHARSDGLLERAMAAVALMSASSGRRSWRKAAALFCRSAQGSPSAWQLMTSIACRYIETALLALPCFNRQFPASFKSSGDGLVTLLPSRCAFAAAAIGQLDCAVALRAGASACPSCLGAHRA